MKNITKVLKNKIRVEQFAPNHTIVNTNEGTMLTSYESNIVFIPRDENIIYLGSNWDYSRTTGKYRNMFLGYDKKELLNMIKNKTAIIKEGL